MLFNLKTPVLLIAFNRPDNTEKVFNRIRQAKPEKLYIAVDAARKDKKGEIEIVNEVIEIVKNVDWPCNVRYRFNESNLGAEITVSSAISWVFEEEDYAIILEDDIIAPISFFEFMQEMLIKYKDEEIIGTVSGNNFTPIETENNEDYFFAKYGHSWGWGTWKRAWKDFDLNIEIPDEHLKLSFFKKITNTRKEALHFKRIFKKMQNRGKGNSTWDFIYLYLHRIKGQLSIIPKVNLTSNIGIYGLHANGQTKYHYQPFDEDFKVKKHPKKIKCFTKYDLYHFSNFITIRKSYVWRITLKIFRKLNIINN